MNKRTVPGKFTSTGRKLDVWHCDSCGYEGTTGCWQAPDGEVGQWCYKCRVQGVKSPLRTIKVDELAWERGWTEVECCGHWVQCHEFTNTCGCCGRDYNHAGQMLAPREQWGEETGESYIDILNV